MNDCLLLLRFITFYCTADGSHSVVITLEGLITNTRCSVLSLEGLITNTRCSVLSVIATAACFNRTQCCKFRPTVELIRISVHWVFLLHLARSGSSQIWKVGIWYIPSCSIYFTIHRHTQPFYGPFLGLCWWAGARRNLVMDFLEQGKITEADTPTIRLGASASGLISYPPPSSPHFHARCPSCCNPPDLSWLGAGTKYAGLHTQWRG